jgi:hypothetical protein
MIIGEKNSGKSFIYSHLTATWTEKVVGVKTQLGKKRQKKAATRQSMIFFEGGTGERGGRARNGKKRMVGGKREGKGREGEGRGRKEGEGEKSREEGGKRDEKREGRGREGGKREGPANFFSATMTEPKREEKNFQNRAFYYMCARKNPNLMMRRFKFLDRVRLPSSSSLLTLFPSIPSLVPSSPAVPSPSSSLPYLVCPPY